MNLSEINWDPSAAGTWPLPVKIAITALICAAVAGAGVYFDTQQQMSDLETLEKKEQELKLDFEAKQKKAVNFPDFQNQYSQIEASLDEMIRQMPTQAELASLLVDISQTGLASGLEFKLFKPKDPVRKDFYSELPIDIEVVGKYQELGLFVSGLASLPRIVTIHDVNMEPLTQTDKNKKGDEGLMTMKAVVKTYNENASESGNKSNKKKNTNKEAK